MKDNKRLDQLAYDKTFDCVQCGYCLPACPTYKTMKKETHSPRGRIHLVKMVAEGNMELDKLKEPIDLCLGCRACERVCPTNVEYGTILESAKDVLQDWKKENQTKVERVIEQGVLQQLFPKQSSLDKVAGMLWLYQKSGVKKMVHRTFLKHMIPERLRLFDKATPQLVRPKIKKIRARRLEPEEAPIYRVGFFQGCVMDTVYTKINDLSMKLLQKAGCEVIRVSQQTCCGALHSHTGERDLAKQLAKQNIEAFECESFDFIVNNAGGCGAMLNEYDRLLKDDADWQKRAEAFVEKSVDISVILNKLDLPMTQSLSYEVTYQPSCHMTNVQGVVDEPRDLLRQIDSLQLNEMKQPDFCCGSAGIYNLVHYKESMEILDEKMADVKTVNASIVVTTNPGCLLQMQTGIEREGLSDRIRAVHLVELLAEACEVH